MRTRCCQLDEIVIISGLCSQYGDKINRNPISNKRIAKRILNGKMDATSTICDGRKYEKTGFSIKELQYKLAIAVTEDKMSYSRTAERFDVSKCFVSKWSRIYRVRKLFNSKYKNRKVPRSIFNLEFITCNQVRDWCINHPSLTRLFRGITVHNHYW